MDQGTQLMISDFQRQLQESAAKVEMLNEQIIELQLADKRKSDEVVNMAETIHYNEILLNRLRTKLNEDIGSINFLSSVIKNLHKMIVVIIESSLKKETTSLKKIDEIIERVKKPEYYTHLTPLSQDIISKIKTISSYQDKYDQLFGNLKKENSTPSKKYSFDLSYIDYQNNPKEHLELTEVAELFNSELSQWKYEMYFSLNHKLRSAIVNNVEDFLKVMPTQEQREASNQLISKLSDMPMVKKSKSIEENINLQKSEEKNSYFLNSETKIQEKTEAPEFSIPPTTRNFSFSSNNQNPHGLLTETNDAKVQILDELKNLRQIIISQKELHESTEQKKQNDLERSMIADDLAELRAKIQITNEEIELVKEEILELSKELKTEKKEYDKVSAELTGLIEKRKVLEIDVSWARNRHDWAETLLKEIEDPSEPGYFTPRGVFSVEGSAPVTTKNEEKLAKASRLDLLSATGDNKNPHFVSFRDSGQSDRKEQSLQEFTASEAKLISLIKNISGASKTNAESVLKSVQEILYSDRKAVELLELQISIMKEEIASLSAKKTQLETEVRLRRAELSDQSQLNWELQNLLNELRVLGIKIKKEVSNGKAIVLSLGDDASNLIERIPKSTSPNENNPEYERENPKGHDQQTFEGIYKNDMNNSLADNESEVASTQRDLKLLNKIYDSVKIIESGKQSDQGKNNLSWQNEHLTDEQKTLSFAYSLIFKLYIGFFTFCSKQFLSAVKVLKPEGYRELKQKMKKHYYSLVRHNKFYQSISEDNDEPRYSLENFVKILKHESIEWNSFMNYLSCLDLNFI